MSRPVVSEPFLFMDISGPVECKSDLRFLVTTYAQDRLVGDDLSRDDAVGVGEGDLAKPPIWSKLLLAGRTMNNHN
ncbi:hypothetical protein G6F46_013663 [Rhizopus delemar]|uniref:Uncharacterized protein n=3 Tax=Rhizopus TaxID=4842 RepID=I1CDJ8_RHIO9|nr:hypothetical protein RO3G_11239 [Rhizopus delemar RA 99-880]KAG1438428.1 hypothetical protein G6F55_013949 [Rhizopus delemar]KAG1530893.1 hypothetical protein G6F51_013691 [Rhizopus arrhizus]KAG1481698.1 hypothetical protein G6F54_013699 [Rhizopus delemar]KAG1489051.1 hypothetical protein G6F53_013484 [Rhizopus delemar]|eukprot:EIE86528.1 hypothetical protein RO3G_11239 [Rhizopus delemar RA 99-880]